MSTTAIVVGFGLAAVGFGGRYLTKRMPAMAKAAEEAMQKGTLGSGGYSKYYKGGFEQKMTKREAGLILGVSPSAPKSKLHESYKRLMSINHPDKNGSPYLSMKISEAKDLLSQKGR